MYVNARYLPAGDHALGGGVERLLHELLRQRHLRHHFATWCTQGEYKITNEMYEHMSNYLERLTLTLRLLSCQRKDRLQAQANIQGRKKIAYPKISSKGTKKRGKEKEKRKEKKE